MEKPVQVTAAILSHQGKFLIAQRKKHSHQGGKWEFPGGKVEDGETPEDCLKREMMEEFNIRISVGEFFGSSIHHDACLSVELLAFSATWIEGEFEMRAHAAFEWVAVRDLGRYDFAPADIPFVKTLQEGCKDL